MGGEIEADHLNSQKADRPQAMLGHRQVERLGLRAQRSAEDVMLARH
jgi:hypothetical protein